MKRTGDYTLIIPCLATDKENSYQIKGLAFDKIPNGSSGGVPWHTFNIKTKSVHDDFYNLHIHASRLLLKNNVTGKVTSYDANRKAA